MADNKKTNKAEQKKDAKPKCGLVMPISSFDEYPEQHWKDVKAILTDAIESAGFNATLVSDADEVGIIHARIIQNLYDNPIVVCDVSGKNPNVMFELGLRLAFDKPTIIVKDDETDYSFDTSIIEHLEYPRGLRHNKIEAFKDDLRGKVDATYKKATSDPSYTTFLKHFGKFRVAQIETTEVSKEDYIMEKLQDIERLVTKISRTDCGLSPHKRSRLDMWYTEKQIEEMKEALGSAIDHLASEGRRIKFPDLQHDVFKYIVTKTDVPLLFKTHKDFEVCLIRTLRSLNL